MYVPVHFNRVNDWLCFAAGYILNGALLWLITKRTEKEMLPYRPILQLSAVINLLYLAVYAVVVPVLLVDRGNNAIISVGPLGWVPQPYNFVLVNSWLFFLNFTIVAECVPFVYRYALLCWKKDHYGIRHYLAMLSCPFLISVVQTAICYNVGYIPAEPSAQQQQEIKKFLSNETATRFIISYFANQESGSQAGVFIAPCVLLSYSLVVILGWRIYHHLKHGATTLSEGRAHEINQQVSRALTLLAFLPLVVETLPGIFLIVMATVSSGLSAGDASAYFTAVFAWSPVVNPLATMWVVRAYRREVGRWLRWLMCKGDGMTTTTIVSSLKPASQRLTALQQPQQSNNRSHKNY